MCGGTVLSIVVGVWCWGREKGFAMEYVGLVVIVTVVESPGRMVFLIYRLDEELVLVNSKGEGPWLCHVFAGGMNHMQGYLPGYHGLVGNVQERRTQNQQGWSSHHHLQGLGILILQ